MSACAAGGRSSVFSWQMAWQTEEEEEEFAMDDQREKDRQKQQESDKRTVKEIKGAVDDPPPSPPKARNPREINKTGDEATQVKGLPHQQVPQPGDFSSEALERL
ncbi:hypothetical protein ACJRO7_035290 [Eucalyptus globulus]|uniref:Uncharacterized protein n=1 Tax=Eucalyptus globulus TaxID=34317 RepID=A0ABD3J8G4_EUCGL